MAHHLTIIIVTDDPDCEGDDGRPWTASSLKTEFSVDAAMDTVLAGITDVVLDAFPDAVDNSNTVGTLAQMRALVAFDGR